MKQILVYSDSLSWGIIPMTRERFDFNQRWPGVMENQLLSLGKNVRVIEDCLNGRRTVYEDAVKPGRNGLVGLAQRIELNSPLALMIVMLGTNDFQFNHDHNASDAAFGMRALIKAIRTAPIEPGMPVPEILVVAAPPIREAKGDIAAKFKGAEIKCIGLADAYRQLCAEMQCRFFDAGLLTASSNVDGVHLDLEQHELLGKALSSYVVGFV
ncbi:SGNH/GDSL hydrolase family protein [Methylotenera sp.]|uniref:SGNH/GDSL hydrolase family protein n=1 Tax=Methylotenera sp. TaxID=2051956 RepID=UPI002EDA07DD